ncbi:hypothetical protein DYB37_003136 [Aphanomyces astaci]|uniref:Uncharacterized protein n=2 Tax=Aphanomyces astaci TaxID=112090 RepID=A0A397CXU0_APHAT|nr:hypothetical protein DYB38_005590 [Aphanomyces astaci]RHY59991.1 hypothetical protein DYB34_003637 [Aphanomyces astaci]RHY96879.1 hypothetical protein DYB35_006948 [Aphanomyces astaci]RHZ34201.1 hypothetical protein DYB37_003136 [Aphanomyces astaci]
MASTVADSCGVYDMTIRDHHMVTGALGDVEHLRPLLEKLDHKYVLLQANELIWMTDCTPHESLPLLATTFRQYFRLVTSGVSLWYADHSTPNPLGIQPNATVIHGNKLRNVVAQDDRLAPIKVWPLVTADAPATESTQVLE